MNSTITLQEYIKAKLPANGSFVIPDYQRGYVWGQEKCDKEKDAVTYLVESLKVGFEHESDIFLQGITVCEDGADIIIVDGQQRTTFFYLLLAYLSGGKPFELKYNIREESNKFLADLCSKGGFETISEDEDAPRQDIFFFQKTIRNFNEELKDIDRQKLKEYILGHIRFLYIDIPKDNATKLFSMMNGNKANMRQEELIKAELLRCSSKKTDDIGEFENNIIRGRLAREWDKWLYWWNRKEVKDFFKTGNQQLGWLLPLMTDSEKVSFEQFKEHNLKDGDVKTAKNIFRKMRLLQRSIEDAFEDAETYNRLGAILCIRDAAERYAVLKWYFNLLNEVCHEEAKKQLERYFNWAFIGLTHKEIIEEHKDKYNEKRKDKYNEKRDYFLTALESDQLYNDNYEVGAMWLLRCNIMEDCTQNRKFNFAIWSDRSLEHIYPKSKVAHMDGEQILDFYDKPLDAKPSDGLWREDIRWKDHTGSEHTASEHSIGNLVLLYKNDNSKFSNKSFEEKKNLYFDIKNDGGFKSRHLLHTISVFANSEWTGETIAEHKQNELEHFNNSYPELQ